VTRIASIILKIMSNVTNFLNKILNIFGYFLKGFVQDRYHRDEIANLADSIPKICGRFCFRLRDFKP